MKKTYSVKRGERGKQGYRHMLLNITEEEIAEIRIELDQYLKDHNKETVTNDEHADLVFRVLREFKEK